MARRVIERRVQLVRLFHATNLFIFLPARQEGAGSRRLRAVGVCCSAYCPSAHVPEGARLRASGMTCNTARSARARGTPRALSPTGTLTRRALIEPPSGLSAPGHGFRSFQNGWRWACRSFRRRGVADAVPARAAANEQIIQHRPRRLPSDFGPMKCRSARTGCGCEKRIAHALDMPGGEFDADARHQLETGQRRAAKILRHAEQLERGSGIVNAGIRWFLARAAPETVSAPAA